MSSFILMLTWEAQLEFRRFCWFAKITPAGGSWFAGGLPWLLNDLPEDIVLFVTPVIFIKRPKFTSCFLIILHIPNSFNFNISICFCASVFYSSYYYEISFHRVLASEGL